MVRRIRSGKWGGGGGKGHRSVLASLADLERVESLLVKHEKTHNADGTSSDGCPRDFDMYISLSPLSA